MGFVAGLDFAELFMAGRFAGRSSLLVDSKPGSRARFVAACRSTSAVGGSQADRPRWAASRGGAAFGRPQRPLPLGRLLDG